MNDAEHGIALHAIQSNRASSCYEWEVSEFFSIYGGNLGYILEFCRDGNSKLVFVQRSQDSCLISRDSSGISPKHGRAIQTFLDVSRVTECPFLVARVILVFLSIFHKRQASSTFEAELPMTHKVSKGYEASCPDEVGT